MNDNARGPIRRRCIVALAAWLTVAVQADAQEQGPRLIRGADGSMVYWQEEDTVLPPYPAESNLRRIPHPMARNRNSYFVDEESIRLGKDGVTRYTVVMRSPSGSINVRYEGIDCDQRLVKGYAYGTVDGRFQPLADQRWRRFRREGPLGYQWALADAFVCDAESSPIAAEKVISRLRDGGQPDDPRWEEDRGDPSK